MPGHIKWLDLLACAVLCLKEIQYAICPGVVMTSGFLFYIISQRQFGIEHMRGVDDYELGVY